MLLITYILLLTDLFMHLIDSWIATPFGPCFCSSSYWTSNCRVS